MKKKQTPIYLTTVDSPLIPIGTLLGNTLYIKLNGINAEEREKMFLMAQQVLAQLVPPQATPQVDTNE